MNKSFRRCLVIGGCGFLGSYVAESLLEAGYQVRIFDRVNVDTANIDAFSRHLEIFYGDLSSRADDEKALEGIDYVFHFAGSTDPKRASEDPVFDVETNVIGTLNLLMALSKENCKKLIFSSSGGTVYGIPSKLPISEDHSTIPICAYGVSKVTVEKYIYLYHYLLGFNYIILRLANPYGPRQNLHNAQGAIVHFLNAINQGKKIQIWGDGSVVRDYFFSGDLKSLIPLLLREEITNSTLNIGKGRGYSLNEILAVIKHLIRKDIDVEYLPGRMIDIPVNYLNVKKVYSETGWSAATELYDGILKTWHWIQDSNKSNH